MMEGATKLSPADQLALMANPVEWEEMTHTGYEEQPVTHEEATALEVPEGTPYSKIKKADRPQMIAVGVHRRYNIIKINHPESFWYKEPEDYTYTPLTDNMIQNWARDSYLNVFGVAEPRDIKATVEMIKIMTMDELDQIDRNWVEVSKGRAYWSNEMGEMHESPDGPCFWRLFDTTVGDKHTVIIPPFTKDQVNRVWQSYKTTCEALKEGSAFKDEPYEFITTWAKGNHDVYLDIVRSIAYCFIKKKPVGSYVLVGLRRNGKSSFVGLLHTIFGRNNTSMVRLSQLGDPHLNYAFTRTLLNAPDEEDEKAIDAQANFKTLSDHGMLSLSVMYSQQAESVHCDFMSFFPMNHIPEWTGAGASACMKRTLVIPFYADLSKFDKSNFCFAEKTFTADFMSEFIGYVLAFANYYSHHELEFSATMKAAQEDIEEDLDSAVLYRSVFEKYFDGFSSIKFLFEDYCNWCKARDMTIQSRKEFKFVFREYMTNRTNYSPHNSSVVYKMYRIPQAEHSPMYEEMPRTEVGDVNWLHDSHISLVERLDNLMEEKAWKGKE